MNFESEKKRISRILKECCAPTEVMDQFDDICERRHEGSTTTAEELLVHVCRQHDFTAPWEDACQVEFYRTTADSERSYRRGYHHGMKRVLDNLAEGVSLEDIKAFAIRIETWRREQPVQQKGAHLGCLRPAGLPPKWDNA